MAASSHILYYTLVHESGYLYCKLLASVLKNQVVEKDGVKNDRGKGMFYRRDVSIVRWRPVYTLDVKHMIYWSARQLPVLICCFGCLAILREIAEGEWFKL